MWRIQDLSKVITKDSLKVVAKPESEPEPITWYYSSSDFVFNLEQEITSNLGLFWFFFQFSTNIFQSNRQYIFPELQIDI